MGKFGIKIYGRLQVLGKARDQKFGKITRAMMLCECECGNKVIVDYTHLIRGDTKSCGCLQKERTREANEKHSMYKSKEYRSWSKMRCRCNNPNNPKYPRYGGRGIRVCDRWNNSFINFYNDMKDKKPRKKNWTIDRINNDGNYEPGNCRWASKKMQSHNSVQSYMTAFDNKVKSETARANEYDIPQNTLSRRIKRWGSLEKAIVNYKPIKRNNHGKTFTHKGQTKTLKEWAEFLDIKLSTLCARINDHGMTFSKAVEFKR